jgi:hypothetical protein
LNHRLNQPCDSQADNRTYRIASKYKGDDSGHSAENSFVDEKLPQSYVPFNVQAIGDDIVVT